MYAAWLLDRRSGALPRMIVYGLVKAMSNALICRCDTRSHFASELADWRADYVGRVVPGACSRSAPPCRALPVTAGCGAQGKAQGPPSHPGVTGEGQAGRVNRVNLR